MKRVWRLICLLYTDFVINFINIKAPDFLFHKPKFKITPFRTQVIHADISFSSEKRKLISEAADDIYRFTNERVKFDIVYDYNPYDNVYYMGSLLVNANAETGVVKSYEDHHKITIIGLCCFLDCGYRDIYLVCDRISSDLMFKTTLIHELGHYIGADHVDGDGIMNAVNSNRILFPTYVDAVELAKSWKCLPSDFRYFKL